MDKVKIKDIAEELGINSKDVLQKAMLMAIDVKSIRSSISIEDAEEIFDAILYNKKIIKQDISVEDTLFYKSKNLNLYISESPVDIHFLSNISIPYTNENIDNFLLLSYNYSDKKLQELYSLSLNKLDIKKYLKNTFNADDFINLEKSIQKFCDDFDMSYIEGQTPLDNIKEYSRKYKPQLIFIEGINFQHIEKNNFKVLKTIKQMALFNIKFELGVVSASSNEKEKLKEKLIENFELSNGGK